MKIAITMDGNSGLTRDEAQRLGATIISTPVLIDGDIFLEDITLTQEQFYERLTSDAQVSTSQPSPAALAEAWDKLLEDYDEIVYIPISSGLAGAYDTAYQLANRELRFKGKVYVVDNQRISITQRQSVLDGLKMASEGKSGKEISEWLISSKSQSSIYIMVGTLKYLKKGGRLTPAVAMIGELLKIKPVLQIQGFKLDQYAKVRKLADAKTTMINAIKKDFETRFKDLVAAGKMTLAVAHTENFEEAERFSQEIKEAFPNVKFTFIDPLSLSVSCHIGPGALAVACSVEY